MSKEGPLSRAEFQKELDRINKDVMPVAKERFEEDDYPYGTGEIDDREESDGFEWVSQ